MSVQNSARSSRSDHEKEGGAEKEQGREQESEDYWIWFHVKERNNDRKRKAPFKGMEAGERID